jgi:hypothetical protein
LSLPSQTKMASLGLAAAAVAIPAPRGLSDPAARIAPAQSFVKGEMSRLSF